MTDEMVEKLSKIGFDLDESTGMSPPRKSRPSSSRGAAAVTVTQWNDDALDDAARGTGAGKDPKNSNTWGNSNSPPKKKRPRKNKKWKASWSTLFINNFMLSNIDFLGDHNMIFISKKPPFQSVL